MAGINRLKQSFPFKSTWSSSPYNKSFALNTWTKRFFCLASRRDRYTTNKDYLSQLDAERLGGKKIQFEDKWVSHEYLIRKFSSEYPPLASQGGAIMLWQCSIGGSHIRLLEILLPGPDGYSVRYLPGKVNSGTIYITPLQSDLIQVNDSTLQQTETISFCRICKTSINLKFFAEHLLECLTSL